MTARKETPPTRYTRSEEMRQAALDLVRQVPGITGSEIFKHFGWPSGTANSRLASMCEMKEMTRTEVWIQVKNMLGRTAPVKTYSYTALVEKTITAEDVRKPAAGTIPKPRKPRVKKAKPAPEVAIPGVYRHKPDQRGHLRPTQQDGQGSGRRRVFVGSLG